MNANFKNEIQTFGRSLLLPIAVLAPVGMVMGISAALGQSYMIDKLPFLGNEIFRAILSSLGLISSVVFNNIPLLFAMGVAYGMSKKEKGIAVFASVVAYLTLLIAMHVHLKLAGTLAKEDMALVGQGMVLGIQTLKIEALGGIIAGLLAAKITDRFYRLQLPLAFAFFSGKKIRRDLSHCFFHSRRLDHSFYLGSVYRRYARHINNNDGTQHWCRYLYDAQSPADPVWPAPRSQFHRAFHRGRRYVPD